MHVDSRVYIDCLPGFQQFLIDWLTSKTKEPLTSACGNLRLQVCYVALSSHGGTEDKKSGPHNYAVYSSLTDLSLLPLKHDLYHVGTPIIPYQCINFMYLSML